VPLVGEFLFKMSSQSDEDNNAAVCEVAPSPVSVTKSKPVETPDDNDNDDVVPEVTEDDHDRANNTSRDSSGEDKTTSKAKRITRQSMRQHEIDQQREKFLSMSLESKRKLYRSKYTTLKEVNTWPVDNAYFLKVGQKVTADQKVAKDELREVREDLNRKISIFQGDITTLEIDAIANAANESLLGGGGVDGAIHRAAGSDLLAECETLNGCDPGDAKITCGYKLPAKYVIHTVGPRGEYPKVLRSCYIHCLELLKKYQLKSIAFPCISTGIFGYPNSKAAKVVLKTIREWLETDEYAVNVERIILCLFLKVDLDAYKRLLPVYFKVADVSKSTDEDKKLNKDSSVSPKKSDDNDKKETEKSEETSTDKLAANI
jgi:O-acetyl-ADP-ribose deacetylase (regulator of RNase III)